METISLQDCLVDGKYNYTRKLTPLENYQYMMQSIAFSRGVEFMAIENIAKKSFLYLYDLPGLSIDIKTAKQELKNFIENILNHIDDVMSDEEDAFIKYAAVYDLFKEVKEDLNYPAPVTFLAIERIYHNSNKLAKIKERNIKLVKGSRKGAFVQHAREGFVQLPFDELGSTIKEYIQDIFKLQNRFKQELFEQVKHRIDILFERKKHLKHYQFTGEQADIAEVAILLYDKITPFGKSNLTLQQFSDDLANFLSVKTFRLCDLKNVLLRRHSTLQLFILKSRQMLSEYLKYLS